MTSKYSSLSSIKNQLKDFINLSSINFILGFLSFFTTQLIANYLGNAQFGNYSYAIALGAYIFTFSNCGNEKTLVRDLIVKKQNINDVMTLSLFTRLFLCVISFIVVIVNDLFITDRVLTISLIIILLSESLRVFSLAHLFDVKNKISLNNNFYFFERIIYFSLIYLSVFIFRNTNLYIIGAAMFISVILGLILQYRYALKYFDFRLGIPFSPLVRSVAFIKGNLWPWLSVLISLGFGGLSKIILMHASDNAEVGNYSMAWQVVTLSGIFLNQIARVINPNLVKIQRSDADTLSKSKYILTCLGLCTFMAILVSMPAIFYPSLLLKLFKPEFLPAAKIFPILGFYAVLVGVGIVPGQYLIIIKKEKQYTLILFAGWVVSLFLFFFLIPTYSGVGAAYSILFGHGLALIFHLVLMLRTIFKQ